MFFREFSTAKFFFCNEDAFHIMYSFNLKKNKNVGNQLILIHYLISSIFLALKLKREKKNQTKLHAVKNKI